MELLIESAFRGSKYTAASPPTSGREPPLLSKQGVLQANASKTGMPKPSYKLGKTNAIEYLYKLAKI